MGYSPWGPKRIRRDLATKRHQLCRHMKALESATRTWSFWILTLSFGSLANDTFDNRSWVKNLKEFPTCYRFSCVPSKVYILKS